MFAMHYCWITLRECFLGVNQSTSYAQQAFFINIRIKYQKFATRYLTASLKNGDFLRKADR